MLRLYQFLKFIRITIRRALRWLTLHTSYVKAILQNVEKFSLMQRCGLVATTVRISARLRVHDCARAFLHHLGLSLFAWVGTASMKYEYANGSSFIFNLKCLTPLCFQRSHKKSAQQFFFCIVYGALVYRTTLKLCLFWKFEYLMLGRVCECMKGVWNASCLRPHPSGNSALRLDLYEGRTSQIC